MTRPTTDEQHAALILYGWTLDSQGVDYWHERGTSWLLAPRDSVASSDIVARNPIRWTLTILTQDHRVTDHNPVTLALKHANLMG